MAKVGLAFNGFPLMGLIRKHTTCNAYGLDSVCFLGLESLIVGLEPLSAARGIC